MAKLIWDKSGERLYETGVKKGVIYPQVMGTYPKGVAWNGLVSVTESPSGAESNPIYADNIKYLNLLSAEEFGATIEAYTYPDEFGKCDGTTELANGVNVGQQKRTPFGLVYQTVLGNDTEGESHGYKVHVIYGALAAPSEKAYESINDSPDAITFSWEVTTTPVDVTGMKPTASIVIDSTKVDAAKLALLENILFGTDGVDARLPLPDEIASMFSAVAPDALTLSISVPAADATAVTVGSNVVMTFNNKIKSENIILMSQDGSIVQSTKAFDTTGKTLTIDPVAPLLAATTYLVVLSEVVDIYNQTLGTTTKKFTTA